MDLSSMTPREAAFFALFKAFSGLCYIEDFLLRWQKARSPSQRDFNLALEIANGTCRQKLALHYLAKKRLGLYSLPRKKKEQILLKLTLYQALFLERIPLFAIVSESVDLAKKWISLPFSKFINASFRKLKGEPKTGLLDLPQGSSLEELSIRTSFPIEFVTRLVQERGFAEAERILHIQNRIHPLHARVRNSSLNLDGKTVLQKPFRVVQVPHGASLHPFTENPEIYIQNGSYIKLLGALADRLESAPKSILDIAAAPGGKLIALHDMFPEASLLANDLRVNLLKTNLKKYGIEAKVTALPAERLSLSKPFDLILCDLPCSNSGVLHRRPEARWRINDQTLKQLSDQQAAILLHAKSLLSPKGKIWYMTCSVLKEENENMAFKLAPFGIVKTFEITCLPDLEGFDGGYGCVLETLKSEL